jgi:hypothetical protein
MGVVKGVVKHKGKKGVNKAVDDMGVVGDVIDKHTTTGPLDAAEDKLDRTKDGKKS